MFVLFAGRLAEMRKGCIGLLVLVGEKGSVRLGSAEEITESSTECRATFQRIARATGTGTLVRAACSACGSVTDRIDACVSYYYYLPSIHQFRSMEDGDSSDFVGVLTFS